MILHTSWVLKLRLYFTNKKERYQEYLLFQIYIFKKEILQSQNNSRSLVSIHNTAHYFNCREQISFYVFIKLMHWNLSYIKVSYFI